MAVVAVGYRQNVSLHFNVKRVEFLPQKECDIKVMTKEECRRCFNEVNFNNNNVPKKIFMLKSFLIHQLCDFNSENILVK